MSFYFNPALRNRYEVTVFLLRMLCCLPLACCWRTYMVALMIIVAMTGRYAQSHHRAYVRRNTTQPIPIRKFFAAVSCSYLNKTHQFYLYHGGKTIFPTRLVPIVRTFVLFIAGNIKECYCHFALSIMLLKYYCGMTAYLRRLLVRRYYDCVIKFLSRFCQRSLNMAE